MVISAIVIPSDVPIALLVNTCPTKATNTVAKDNSIVFAKMAVNTLAVDRDMEPSDDILWPHLGCAMATPNQMPLRMVE
jgi:hypothetical protein